ncbi:MAG TPA: DUF2950 domain-containing protein [Burkholderiales bacterium]|nr:DUF2950 domain-containing protein [Burkholderiales bacterium]
MSTATHMAMWCSWRRMLRGIACATALCVAASGAIAADVIQKSFDSPEAAVTALVQAVKANDLAALHGILGPHSGKLINSGDPAADQEDRDKFLRVYDEAHKLTQENGNKVVLIIGKDEWPMPIPLVKSGGRWRFDAQQGREEILSRRIGRNELAAIQVCLAIVDAEREYAAHDWDGDGVLRYAPKFISAPGQRDGLYWESRPGEPSSPLGPLVAAAAQDENQRLNRPSAPYHGYYYKMLTAQGDEAQGGAYDYMVKGKMIGGFAVIAYPARYGASGVMSFIVNYDGAVYQKNLGKDTAAAVLKMTLFDPDSGWEKQQP